MLAAEQVRPEPILFAAGAWCGAGVLLDGVLPAADPFADPDVADALVDAAAASRATPMLAALAEHVGWSVPPAVARLSAFFADVLPRLHDGLRPVLDRLAAQGIEVMVLKGTDLALTAYPPDLPRAVGDLDLLVAPQDVDAVAAAFRAEGFRQGRFDHDAFRVLPVTEAERDAVERDHYELMAFLKVVAAPGLPDPDAPPARRWPVRAGWVGEAGPALLLNYDVHFNVSEGFDVADAWHAPRRVRLPSGAMVLAQSPTAMCWFLAARCYQETMAAGEPGYRPFADVLALLRAHGAGIDWERLLAVARRYAMQASLFYVLWHARALLGDEAVPEWVLAALSPAQPGTPRGRDFGDLLPRLLGTVVLARLESPIAAR